MINFTKTEWLIIECLKKWAKNAFEIEQCVDPNKEFSKDYISVMINNINKKAWRKIVVWKNISWEYKYMLIEDSIEYRILDSIDSTMSELETVKKIACESCAYKANIESNFKLNLIIAIFLFVIWIMMGFFIGFTNVKPIVEATIDCSELGRFFNTWSQTK